METHYTSYEVAVKNPLTDAMYWLPRHEREHPGEWVTRGACSCGFESDATLSINEARKAIRHHRQSLAA